MIDEDKSKERLIEELAESKSLAKFPSENPNPVLRIAKDGTVLYANDASRPLLSEWGCQIGGFAPDNWKQLVADIYKSNVSKEIQFEQGDRMIAALFIPVKDSDYIYLYGRDITELFQAQGDLRRAKDELEIRVVERTAELSNANENLRNEIIERERIENELRESESRFRKIFENSNDAIFIIDPEQDEILDINSRAHTMLGYSREELLALGVSAIHPTEMPRFLAFAKSVSQQDVGWTDELTCLTKNKEVIPAEISASVIEIAGVSYIIALVRDITARKAAEEALRESEERFRRLVDQAADSFFIRDIEGRIVDVNQSACESLGYTHEELIGLSVSEINPNFDAVEAEKVLKQVVSSGPTTLESTHRRKDGSTFPVEIRIGSIELGGDQYFLSLARDITARKAAEEALHYRVEFEELITSISTNFINLSSNEIDDGINHALGAAGEFAGVDQVFIYQIGEDKADLNMTHDWHAKGIEHQIDKSKQLPFDRMPWAMEKLKRFESIHIFRVSELPPEAKTEKESLQSMDVQSHIAIPIVYGRSLVGVLGFNSVDEEKTWKEEDIAMMKAVGDIFANALEHKRTEEVLRMAKDAAESANRTKSDFLANMSHELRTPLNAIIGFSEVLVDKTFGEINKKQGRYIDNILTSGRHLLQLINDILDLSKVEAGKMELELSKVKVKDLLENSLIMVRERASRHGVNLDLGGELEGLEIEADERKLKQIMFNLLSNAVKFTPDGGRVGVKGLRGGEGIIISVSDTGIGIKGEDQERIFEAFEQANSTSSGNQQGTGLGLALTRRFVELHGGRIWVESDGRGKGSKFNFSIPLLQ